MTIEEAIIELRNIRPRGGIIPQKRAESLDMAIKALEKQIPKKVEEGINSYMHCPVCGYTLSAGYYKARYCHGCGQALDWSEV